MSLFKKAENEQAYLKCGIRGFEKSGKSRTATNIAIGLHKYIKSSSFLSSNFKNVRQIAIANG